jgi:hypothetical protein
LSLRLQSSATPAARADAVAAVIAAYPEEYDLDHESLPPVLARLIEDDGLEVHLSWILVLLPRLLICRTLWDSNLRLMEICVKNMPENSLLAILQSVTDSPESPSMEEPGEVKAGVRLVYLRPDLKEQIMSAIGVGAQMSSELWDWALELLNPYAKNR